MRYCLDTNAVIAICISDESLNTFIRKTASSSDQFFIPSYVMDEFVAGYKKCPDQEPRGVELVALENVQVGQEHFFTLDESLLGGTDILASGSSGFSEIKYSQNDYHALGLSGNYPKWRRRQLNDHLIAEMSESRSCDAIITKNKSDFNKIHGLEGIEIISFVEFMHRHS